MQPPFRSTLCLPPLHHVAYDICPHRTSWLSYYRLLGMPVLVGLNSADTALDIEALNDEDVVAEAMEVRVCACTREGGKERGEPLGGGNSQAETDSLPKLSIDSSTTGLALPQSQTLCGTQSHTPFLLMLLLVMLYLCPPAPPKKALGKAFSNNGSKPLPSPIETHVTRWGTDPYARGAYSYFATGNPKNITGWSVWCVLCDERERRQWMGICHD